LLKLEAMPEPRTALSLPIEFALFMGVIDEDIICVLIAIVESFLSASCGQ
jgi:hypothetical protein